MARMLRMPVLLVMTLSLSACCCGVPTATAMDEGFSAEAGDGRLVLRNRLDVTVHYVALEEETATRVDLYPDPTKWASVAPGSEVRIPYPDVTGYTPQAERAVIHWWTAEASYREPLRVPFR